MERSEAIREIRRLLECLEVPDDSHQAHAAVADTLRAAGWQVRREVAVVTPGDGSGGRVDIEASRGEQIVGIEIDRSRPRRKSVTKLRCRGWVRVIALRDPVDEYLHVPDDFVLVRMAPETFG